MRNYVALVARHTAAVLTLFLHLHALGTAEIMETVSIACFCVHTL